MNVALTILEQLGGGRFICMTNAKNLVRSENALQFDLSKKDTKNKATRCVVTLDATDTYTVSFYQWNARKLEMKQISSTSGVYADMLREIFTSETGLYCTL